MDHRQEEAFADCLRLLQETGRLELCLERYPEFREDLLFYSTISEDLTRGAPAPDASVSLSGRRLLLSAVASQHKRRQFMIDKKWLRLIGPAAGLSLLFAGALGAAASSAGVSNPVGDVLGVNGSPDKGQGHEQEDQDDDATTSDAEATTDPTATATSEAEDGDGPTAEADATSTPTHGQAVSKAVHDAIASSTPGAGRGQAVSQAACEAAHDRKTLPEGAQNAPGQTDREPKDCSKLGNAPEATGTPEGTPTSTSESNQSSGPGQGKGQGQGKNKNK